MDNKQDIIETINALEHIKVKVNELKSLTHYLVNNGIDNVMLLSCIDSYLNVIDDNIIEQNDLYRQEGT
ncbi:MAG: hypothetical protein WC981_03600 [Candidatus Dojkabacteria bacterium]